MVLINALQELIRHYFSIIYGNNSVNEYTQAHFILGTKVNLHGFETFSYIDVHRVIYVYKGHLTINYKSKDYVVTYYHDNNIFYFFNDVVQA